MKRSTSFSLSSQNRKWQSSKHQGILVRLITTTKLTCTSCLSGRFESHVCFCLQLLSPCRKMLRNPGQKRHSVNWRGHHMTPPLQPPSLTHRPLSTGSRGLEAELVLSPWQHPRMTKSSSVSLIWPYSHHHDNNRKSWCKILKHTWVVSSTSCCINLQSSSRCAWRWAPWRWSWLPSAMSSK